MTSAKPRPPLAPGETRAYPVLPLRDIVVFPHVIAPLFVGRKKSIGALDEVMRSDTFVMLATQNHMVLYADPLIISQTVEALVGQTEPQRASEARPVVDFGQGSNE